MPRLIRAKYVLADEVFAIEDYDLKYAVMARLTARYRDVTAIATANPSTILRLLEQIRADLPEIADEAAHGGSPLIAQLPARLAPPIKALLLHELEEGEAYYIIVTTLTGLARYHMNDIVRVSGRGGLTPALAFMRKNRGVTNITGDKLSEDQVNLAVAGLIKEAGTAVPFYVVVADPAAEPRLVSRLAAQLDQRLRQLNIEYDSRRASNRLQPLVLAALREEAEQPNRTGEHPCQRPTTPRLAASSAMRGLAVPIKI
jgi:hypothetical protein